MGLLDFAKDVGRQLFDTDAEAADNIRQHLEIKLSGVKDLSVEFDDGVATLCGECANEATRNNAILMAGNVQGVEKIIADDLTFFVAGKRFRFTLRAPMPQDSRLVRFDQWR